MNTKMNGQQDQIMIKKIHLNIPYLYSSQLTKNKTNLFSPSANATVSKLGQLRIKERVKNMNFEVIFFLAIFANQVKIKIYDL